MRLRTRLLLFIGMTVAFFIVIAVVWHFIAPGYDRALAAAADRFAPAHTAISYEQSSIYVFLQQPGTPAGAYQIEPLDLEYGLLLVLALIAATPGMRLRQRLTALPIALVLMFILHLAGILVFANVASSETPDSIGSNPFVILFGIFGADLFPVLVWGGIAFKYFLRGAPEPHAPRVRPGPEGKRQRA